MASEIIREFKQSLRNDEIYSFRGPLSPLMCAIPWAIQDNSFFLLFINKGRDSFWAIDEDKYFDYARRTFDAYVKGRISLQELEDDYHHLSNTIDLFYSQAISKDLKNLTDAELVELVTKSEQLLIELIDKTLYIETLDIPIVLSVLGNGKEGFLNSIWEKATHPAFYSFEMRRLKFVLSKIESLGTLPLPDSLVRELKYLYTDYFFPKKDTEVKKLVSEIILEKESKKEILNQFKMQFGKDLSVHDAWLTSLNSEEKKIVEYVQFVMECRDLRKDPIAKTQAVTGEIGAEMCERAGIPPELAYALIPGECVKGIKYLKERRDEILKRKDGFIGLVDNKGEYKSELGDFDVLLREFNEVISKKGNDNRILKGQVAHKGKVTGIVRVVLDPHDDKGFKKGDILVTSMTRPEFVPIMKHAGAVVTNEGGITCHAAIVSRELKIPCVIGTKVATHVLKDGDMVEVDAEKGIVTIIK
jgi:phosphohistidine swiveling domain-containing protein